MEIIPVQDIFISFQVLVLFEVYIILQLTKRLRKPLRISRRVAIQKPSAVMTHMVTQLMPGFRQAAELLSQ